MASPQITFRLTDELGDEVNARAAEIGLTATAKRDLERYYWLLKMLTPRFDPREAAVIYDALLDFSRHLHSIPYVWAEVAEQIGAKTLDGKWGIDGDVLVDRLRTLSQGERLRLVDIMEQARLATALRDFEEDQRAWRILLESGLVGRPRHPPEPTTP